jgi:hypothetical protein
MKFPPLEYDDRVALGENPSTVMGFDGTISANPPLPKLLRQLMERLVVMQPPSSENRMAYLRHIRDSLISLTDWTQANDSPLSETQRAAWATYRQSLRDLPSVYGGEGPIPWPVAPT